MSHILIPETIRGDQISTRIVRLRDGATVAVVEMTQEELDLVNDLSQGTRVRPASL